MKTAQDCSYSREAIRAWVSEGALGQQTNQRRAHLAACADCRRYAEELRAAAAGLRWLADRPAEPSPGFRARWTRAVEAAAQPTSLGEAAAALASWLREMLLRNRRPALGVASLWFLALLFRLSAPDVTTTAQPAAARSPVEIFRALKASKQLMAGELGQRPLVPASPRRPDSARPRSERLAPEPMADAPHLTHLTLSNHLTHSTIPLQPGRAGARVA